MTDWYTPTAENFFGKISRKTILTVLDQAKGAPQGPGLEQLNKTDLASRAAQIVQGTGWLPSPLRPREQRQCKHRSGYPRGG
jgi:ParB family transcriptional regulator, chromosome partitioning protein